MIKDQSQSRILNITTLQSSVSLPTVNIIFLTVRYVTAATLAEVTSSNPQPTCLRWNVKDKTATSIDESIELHPEVRDSTISCISQDLLVTKYRQHFFQFKVS